MIDIKKLKALAEAATPGKWTTDGDVTVIAAGSDQLNHGYAVCECRGPESPQNADFIAAANPATALALIAENERLKQFEDEFTVWIEKTEWVQTTGKAIELGLHRADVLRLRIDRLQVEVEALRACLTETVGVAVTMLYESHKADTLKEFNVEELTQMVDSTKHLADANARVEKVYRKAWGMAQGGADHG